MLIFDRIRRKYIALTPEELVRQHLINFLITEKNYPASLISVETPIKSARLKKRSDLLISNCNGLPLMLAECKAPDVAITNKVFEQISVYNLTIQAPYLLVTNGVNHFCLTSATKTAPAAFLNEIPEYEELKRFSLKPK